MRTVSAELVTQLLMVLGAVAWVAAFVFAIRIVHHARRLVSPPWYINWTPLNLVAKPDLWTPESKRDCIAFYISSACFFAVGVTAVLIE
jgi:hypothetical protein